MTDREALSRLEKQRAPFADVAARRTACDDDLVYAIQMKQMYDVAISALRDRIEREDGWVSVEDPPKQDGFYIVYMLGDIWGEPDKWGVTACGFYDGQWDEDGATISHWQPLPAPPSEKGEEP